MFLRPLFEKTDEAGRFYLFMFVISQKTNEAPFFVHFKYKNVDILFLTYE